MDKKELEELCLKQSDKILNALKDGDREKALKECQALPKEFILIHKGLRKVIEFIMQYIEQYFREAQAKISKETEEAIRNKDDEKAKSLLEQREKQHLLIHDVYIEMMVSCFSYMGKVYGDKGLEGVLRHSGEMQKEGFTAWENMPVEDFVRSTAHLMKTHMGKVKLIEDDEKFTFIHDPCGSGGRLMRERAYDLPKNYYKIKDAKPIGFGEKDYPSYCAHCAVWNNVQSTEWFGHPQWVHEPAKSPDDPCVFHIYKDPKKIPEKFFKRIAKEKKN